MCMLSAIGLPRCPKSAFNGSTNETANSTRARRSELKLLLNESLLSVSYANLSSSNGNGNLETFEQSSRLQALTQLSRNDFAANSSFAYGNVDDDDDESGCVHKEYIVFTWVLCLVSLATALKLYYLVKAIMALGMVAFYTALILIRFKDDKSIFSLDHLKEQGMPLGVQMLILLITFLVMVCYHARLVEVRHNPA